MTKPSLLEKYVIIGFNGSAIANDYMEFFETVIGQDYLNYTSQFASPDHWLFLLACSTVINCGEAADDLMQALYKHKIPNTFGFTASSFNAHLASDFIANFGTHVIIKNADLSAKSLCHLLDMSYNLHRHGTILLFCFKPGVDWIIQEQYKWHHLQLQPGGIPLPMQCSHCKCIGCLKAFH